MHITKQHIFKGPPHRVAPYADVEASAFVVSLPLIIAGELYLTRGMPVAVSREAVVEMARSVPQLPNVLGHEVTPDGALWALISLTGGTAEAVRLEMRRNGRVKTRLYFTRNPVEAKRLVVEVS